MMTGRLSAVMTAVVVAMTLAPHDAQALQPAVAAQTAQSLLQPGQAAAFLAKASDLDGFHPRREGAQQRDDSGGVHLRFERTHQGLPVLGGDTVVHLSPDGRLVGVRTMLAKPLNLASITPSVDKAQAQAYVETLFQQEGRLKSTTIELMIVAPSSLLSAKPALVWLAKVRGSRCGQPSWMHYAIDAHSGAVLKKYEGQRSLVKIECDKPDAASTPATELAASNAARKRGKPTSAAPSPLTAAVGTGKSLYYGLLSVDADKISDVRYEIKDTTRGNHFVSDFGVDVAVPMFDADNAWGDGTTADRASVAVDAAFGQRMTWEFYKTLGRNGLGNDGAGYSSTVHYQDVIGTDADNAYWQNDRMNYGDGLVKFKPLACLDVAGHEMTHGLTEKTAGLDYEHESGGLDEASSDIFGTMVEYYTNDPQDPPDYTIGEKIMKNGQPALRYMYQPSKDGSSFDCWYAGTNGLDPHESSGVGNHFFYLLAEGSKPSGLPASKVCKANESNTASDTINFEGIGRAKSQKLWYDMLTTKLTSTSTFADARKGMLELTADDSDEYRRVNYAWLAVNVTDLKKVTSYVNNRSWQTAQIVTPTTELMVMGRRGVAGKAHWYAVYLNAGQSVEANLTAGDAPSDFDLVGYDSTGKKQLVKSKTGGGAKEKITLKNNETARKLYYISVPYVSGSAGFMLQLKLV